MGNKAIELKADGVSVLLAYEEALGYCVGDVICDKDGISAASVFIEMANYLKIKKNMSVKEHLQHLYSKYGEFVSLNSYVFCHDPKLTDKIFERLRNNGKYWESCSGSKITAIKDVTLGYDSKSDDHKSDLPVTPDCHMIMFDFENGCSVTLRTSGTEPKIKYYTEMAGAIGQSRDDVQAKLVEFVNNLVNEMIQPDEHGLKRA